MTKFLEPALRDIDTNIASTSNPQSSLLQPLKSVNWDFPERVPDTDIEGIHPYPAKFIAELPRTLLSALPVPDGTAVFDPFCGSGTALVECQRLGITASGIDLNPIACLMSRVKTAHFDSDLESYAQESVVKAKEQPLGNVPAIPNLDHWFEQGIQEELVRLITVISSAPVSMQDCLRLALSSIIVRVSNQESDTRYAAIRKNIKPKDVAGLFLRAVERIGAALRSRSYPLTPVYIIEGDTLAINPAQITQPIGLVITSPPYPNAYEYWLYHKYRMWWLGFDPISVKAQEIGARAHFFKKNPHTADNFICQMQQTFRLLRQVMVPGGYVCFVVGRSRIHGQIVDNARIIEDAGHSFGFYRFFSTERVLSANRKSFNLSHANIKTETVLVLKMETQ